MKSNAMAGAVSLVGMGLCGIAVAMLLQVTGTRADASPRADLNFGPEEPTIVWMGMSGDYNHMNFARLWSDGTLQYRKVINNGNCTLYPLTCDWIEIPPAANDPVACRQDVNGDGNVDGEDLGLLLIEWGDAACEVQPTYPCFDLAGLQLPQ